MPASLLSCSAAEYSTQAKPWSVSWLRSEPSSTWAFSKPQAGARITAIRVNGRARIRSACMSFPQQLYGASPLVQLQGQALKRKKGRIFAVRLPPRSRRIVYGVIGSLAFDILAAVDYKTAPMELNRRQVCYLR